MVTVEQDDRIYIGKLEIAPFGTNAYVIKCRATGDSVLVDAPGEPQRIEQALEGSNPKYILMTHSHIDHVGALVELRSRLGVSVAAHEADARSLPAGPDILFNDGDEIALGNVRLRVLHTPGHTPGSLCFFTGHYLISGDTLFPGGPGKTGSTGDLKRIIESITTKIFVLPDETRVYPGHGDSTVLSREKEEFAVFSSRPHNPNLCGDVLWLTS